MAIDNLPTSTSTDESRLSGAYIRTLVKQLTSSKPINTKENLISNDSVIVGEYHQSSVSNQGDNLGMPKQNKQQHGHGHKKQVRRRLHTSRPYQERLLNMAEARKEIVTALKFHRASMKQADEKKQRQQQHQQDQQQRQHQSLRPKSEPSHFTHTNVKVENFPCYPSYNHYYSNSYPWLISSSPLVEPPLLHESLNIPLPNQTLGLNLNLQAFTNLDTTFCQNTNTPSSNLKYSPSSPMSPSSSSSSTPIDLNVVAAVAEGVGSICGNDAMDMHPALGEEEIAEIRSIGEQHQIEWDDTLNLVKSACWLKFLKKVECGRENKGDQECDHDNSQHDDHHPFGEFMEFPSWLSANDQSFLQHLDDSCSEDTALPWMDIGDIDGMDDEWLS